MSTIKVLTRAVLLCFGCTITSSFAQTFDAPTADPLDRLAMDRPVIGNVLMSSVSENNGHWAIVGERGYIYTREGEKGPWAQSRVPTSVLLTSVLMDNGGQGWAVGHSGIILATDDGGRSWKKQMDGIEGARITASGAETEAEKRDARFLLDEGADKPLFNIARIDNERVLVVGSYGLAFETLDGGENWKSIKYQLPNPMGAHLYGIEVKGDTVFIAGEMGTIIRSRNKGATYEKLNSPYDGSFFGLCMLSSENIIVYGLKGHAYTSSDGGESWEKSSIASEASISACTVVGDNVYLGNQAGEIFLSKDQGTTFRFVGSAHVGPLLDLHKISDQKLLTVGMRGQHSVDLQVSP